MRFLESMPSLPPDRPGGPGVRQHEPRRPRGIASTIVVTEDRHRTGRFVARANSPWLRALVNMCGSSLDRQLAAGRRPEVNRLLAARAVTLVSPSMRASVARNWRDLLGQLRNPPLAKNPRISLCRDRIVAAEGAVRDMLDALSSSPSTPARGVAMASWMLSDGAGPLYNRHCATDLSTALQEITAQLDPAVSLTA